MSCFEVIAPDTMPALTASLKRLTPQSRILAGGTDIIIAIRKGEVTPDTLLDISAVEALGTIRQDGAHIVVGANATFTDILKNELVLKHATCLTEAAAVIGSVQIRNRATIAGNICTASPAGDAIPPLYALGATVSILDSSGGIRQEPIEKLFAGPYRTTLNHDEAIVDFRFPLRKRVSTFVKLGSRSTVTIARLGLAVALELSSDQSAVDAARVAMGAVGRTVFRSPRAEGVLTGASLGQDLAEPFLSALAAEIDASIPGRYSLPYKRAAIAGLAQQALANLLKISPSRSS